MGNNIKAGVFFVTAVLVLAALAPFAADAQTVSQNNTTNESQNLPNIDYVQTTAHDLLTGKIKTIPGGVDTTNMSSNYRPSANLNPLPNGVASPMAVDISAGYQVFGGNNNVYAGEVSGETSTIPSLVDDFAEYAVIHSWASQSGRSSNNENAVVMGRYGNTPDFGIMIAQLGNYQDGVYQDWWSGTGSASDTYYIEVYPILNNGNRNYNQIDYLIWDLNNNNYFTKTYTLPNYESIVSVDSALEQPVNNPANSQWFYFTQFVADDQNYNQINLQNNFQWLEWSFSEMNNVHSENYQLNGLEATLGQEKTPK